MSTPNPGPAQGPPEPVCLHGSYSGTSPPASCAVASPSARKKSTFTTWQVLNVSALLLLPKCSLCLFAVGSAITVCGLPEPTTPVWEYGLMGLLAFSPITLFACRCRRIWTQPAAWGMALGGLLVLLFMWLDLPSLWYYLGVGMLGLSTLWTLTQRWMARRGFFP